eukprot:15364855-Ditylum_brightwellii.AAC.2
MTNAEKYHHIDDEKHGGQNRQNTIDIVLGKSFIVDMLQFQRADFGCTDCDAKSCYNHIIPL